MSVDSVTFDETNRNENMEIHILAEMLAESKLPSSKVEGTFENDVLASNAVEFNKVEGKRSYFQTTTGTRFVALETVAVNGEAEINVEAVVAGANGNVAAGTITVIPMSIAGINSVINAEATIL